MKKRICIIDDDVDYIFDLTLLLKKKYDILSANNPSTGFELLKNEQIDILILDLDFGLSETGIDWIPKYLQIDPFLPIIVISSFTMPKVIVEALHLGAIDYIHKSDVIAEIEETFEKSIAKVASLKVEKYIMNLPKNGNIIYESKVMNNLLEEAKMVADSGVPILITGENGVGKGILAKFIHNSSKRDKNNFVTIHAPSLQDTLFESELFGYDKGAFTGADKNKIGKVEFAENGTLLLDEITETSVLNQAKLLRLIENKEYEKVGGIKTKKADVNFIACTNKDINKLISEGKFRQDLYYRLAGYELHIPALRERKEDIIPIAEYILQRYSKKLNKRIIGISESAKQYLLGCDWPGNVRELINLIERSVIRCPENKFITRSYFSDKSKSVSFLNYNSKIEPYHKAAEQNLLQFKKEYVMNVLEISDGIVTKAAELAKLPRQSLSRMLHETGITISEFKNETQELHKNT